MKNFVELAAYLKSSRELSGISIEDFAKLTKIPKHTLLALECGNNIRLPPSIFVRGYINSYTTELNLPAEETIAVYDEILLKKNTIDHERKKAIKQIELEKLLIKKKKNNKMIFSFFIGLLAIAIMLALFLFALKFIKNKATDTTKLKNDEFELVTLPVDIMSTVESVPEVEPELNNISNAISQESMRESKKVEEKNAITDDKDSLISDNKRIETIKKPIRLIVSGNTWVLVENRKGTVFSGLARSGQIVELEGEPPFVLKVGMPEHVKIENKGVITSFDKAKSEGMFGVTFL